MKVRFLIVIVTLFSVFASCRKDELEVIPDDIMKKILVECAFMDSYSKKIIPTQSVDSMSFFEPVFKKYNCSVADFRFTLEELARRKSNVLEVLVDESVAELDITRSVAEFRNELNIEWVKRALDSTKITLYKCADTITIKSLDSLHHGYLNIAMDKPGSYEIKYRYKIDSTDKNSTRYLFYHIRDSISKKDFNTGSKWLKYEKDSALWVTHSMEVNKIDTAINELKYELIYFGNKNKYAKKINMRIDSVEVTYYYPEDIASALYMQRKLGFEPINKLYNDIMYSEIYFEPRSNYVVRDSADLIQIDTLIYDLVYVRDSVMYIKDIGGVVDTIGIIDIVNRSVDTTELVNLYPKNRASKFFLERALGEMLLSELHHGFMQGDAILNPPKRWRVLQDSLPIAERDTVAFEYYQFGE